MLWQNAATGFHFQGDFSASRLRAALSPGREKTCHGGWKGLATETLLVLAFSVMLVSKHSLAGLEESERWIIESLRAGWQVASASFAGKYLYEGLSPDAAATCFQNALPKGPFDTEISVPWGFVILSGNSTQSHNIWIFFSLANLNWNSTPF